MYSKRQLEEFPHRKQLEEKCGLVDKSQDISIAYNFLFLLLVYTIRAMCSPSFFVM